MRIYTKGSTTVELHNIEGDEIEYIELAVDWSYYYDSGNYDEPEECEFDIINSMVISKNSHPLRVYEDAPEWVDWDDVTYRVQQTEGLI
jgi:hypothetical protein